MAGAFTQHQLLSIAAAVLEPSGARLVDFGDADVSVEAGLGMRKRRMDVPTEALLRWLEADPSHPKAGAVSYFRGIAAVAVAPRLARREAELPFTQAAARILPSLEGPLFRAGAEAAGKQPIFGTDTFGGLFVAHFQEVNQGRCLVTEADRARWSVTAEHLEKAALSIAYHRAAEEPLAPVPELEGARRLHTGDGSDGARALLIEQLFYTQARSGFAVGVPDPDTFLLFESFEPVRLGAFRELVRARYERSPWPLSDEVFAFRGGAIEGPI
jgi:hypothetical protein